jgi:Amt family ammonium transporter
VAILATIVYSLVVTLIILYVVKAIVGLKVTEEDEVVGCDTSEHGETAYNI